MLRRGKNMETTRQKKRVRLRGYSEIPFYWHPRKKKVDKGNKGVFERIDK